MATTFKVRVVRNKCYGGFGVSEAAVRRMRELGSVEALDEVLCGEKYANGTVNESGFAGYLRDIQRNDPLLLQVVEELGARANGDCADLEVREYTVCLSFEERDGKEGSPEAWVSLLG